MSLSQPCRVTACRSGSFLYWEEGDTWWAKTTTAPGERQLGIGFLLSLRVLQLWLVVLKLNAALQGKGTNVQHRLVHRQIASPSHVSRYFCHIPKVATPALPTQSQKRRSESRAEVWAFVSYLTRREMKPKPKTFASTLRCSWQGPRTHVHIQFQHPQSPAFCCTLALHWCAHTMVQTNRIIDFLLNYPDLQ